MPDNPQAGDTNTAADVPAQGPPPPRRGPGHRAADARDTAAEMAARAHEISLEAGSKMAGAMREVIGAAAGLSAFAIESARDLVHYMVRRGQMGQEEAEQLIAVAEAAYIAKHGSLPKPEPKAPPAKPVPLGSTAKDQAASAASRGLPKPDFGPPRVDMKPEVRHEVKAEVKPVVKAEPEEEVAPKPAPKVEVAVKAPAKPAAPPAKPAAKAPAKPVVTKVAAKPAVKAPAKPAAKPTSSKAPVKATAKPATKAAAKPAAKKPAGKKK